MFKFHGKGKNPLAKAAKKVAIAKVTTKKDIAQDKIIKRLAKTLKNVEIKYFDDFSAGTLGITQTPTIFSLSNIAQGSDLTNRVGDKITPKWLMLQYELQQAAAMVGYNNFVRVVIVKDKEQNGVDPTYSGADDSVFEAPVAGVTECLVPKLKTNLKQFQILYDKTHNLGTQSTTATQTFNNGNVGIKVKKLIKLSGQIFYDAAGGADASCKENNLYMMVISQQNVASAINFNRYTRLAFTDL